MPVSTVSAKFKLPPFSFSPSRPCHIHRAVDTPFVLPSRAFSVFQSLLQVPVTAFNLLGRSPFILLSLRLQPLLVYSIIDFTSAQSYIHLPCSLSTAPSLVPARRVTVTHSLSPNFAAQQGPQGRHSVIPDRSKHNTIKLESLCILPYILGLCTSCVSKPLLRWRSCLHASSQPLLQKDSLIRIHFAADMGLWRTSSAAKHLASSTVNSRRVTSSHRGLHHLHQCRLHPASQPT